MSSNNNGKKKLISSTSLGTSPTSTSIPSTISGTSSGSGFLQKTLNHLPMFFTNQTHNLISNNDEEQSLHTVGSPKKDFFKLKLKSNISPNVSPTSSPPFSKCQLTPLTKKTDYFVFNESDELNNLDNSAQLTLLEGHGTKVSNPKLLENKTHKKLKHQAFSLSSAFSSITASTLLIPQLASNNQVANHLSTPIQQSEKTVSTIKSGNSKQITIIDTLSSKTTLLNSGLFLNESKNGIKNYKDHINTKNVRRRSSTLNANLNLWLNRKNADTVHECAYATSQFLKALDKINSGYDVTIDNATIVGKSIENEFSNRISVNSSLGILIGASDIKFRKKLLKLQQRQQDFIYAASNYLPTGYERRKKAFAADNLSYTEFDEPEEIRKDEPINNKSVMRGLCRAISVLSLIVADEENPTGEKLSINKVSLTSSLTDVNEDLINEKNNEIGRVTKWAVGFEKLLHDPLGLQIFTEFLKKEFSQENIDFWVKCDNFEKLTNEEEMKRVANEIWYVYLDTSSMTQINVDSKSRASCKEGLSNPNNKMFERAKNHIFNLMRYDSYSRFLKSQLYKDCIVNEMEGKPLLYGNSNEKQIKKPSSSQGAHASSINDCELNSGSNSSATTNNNVLIGAANSPSPGSHNLQISSPDLLNPNASNFSFPLSSSSLNNINTNTTSIVSSTTSSDSQSLNRKEKKRSTILPWTKGKEKKHPYLNEQTNQQSLTLFKDNNSSIGTQSQAAVKTFSNKTPLVISSQNSSPNQNSNYDAKFHFNDTNNYQTMETSGFLNASLTLTNQMEGKFCRVLHNDSSTIIQTISGQTVYQCLSKIFIKKQIPWYKCDIYFHDEFNPVDQQMDSDMIASKEICLVERSLFALSLIPIAINLCIKSSYKKCIGVILQPILDFYQIDTTECAIYLNSTTCLLNLNEPCSSIDNQHILVVHKHQASLLSQTEIDKYIRISISDFIPTNLNDYSIEFDELGILKQVKKKKFKIDKQRNLSKNNSLLSNTSSCSGSNHHTSSYININHNNNNNINNCNNSNFKLFNACTLKTNEEQGHLIELLNRAQNFSLDDQRGKLDCKNLEVPEFLNILSNSLIKSQSLNQNISNCASQNNYGYFINKTGKKKNNLMGAFNESTSSLPVATVSSPFCTKNIKKQSNYVEFRSRSPIMIIYDSEDLEQTQDKLNMKAKNDNLNFSATQNNQSSFNTPIEKEDKISLYDSIQSVPLNTKSPKNLIIHNSLSSSPIRSNFNESNKQNNSESHSKAKTQISYV